MTKSDAQAQIMLSATSRTQVTITPVGAPTGQGVLINYITDTGNQPKTFLNQIYVWQTTENTVPWEKEPVGSTPIATDSSTSTQFVKFPFEDKGYIIGYATAPTPQAVCATVFIPQGKQNDPRAFEYDSVTAQARPFPNMIQVQYHTPSLYTPGAYKNWVGLMLGGHASYSAPILQEAAVTTDSQDGSVIIDGVTLLIGTTYTVGYFMSCDEEVHKATMDNADKTAPGSACTKKTGRTSLAASSTFTVGSSA